MIETSDSTRLRPRDRAQRTLRQWIEDGVLPAGEPLPSEQVLAERLQVNRGTLRTALASLQENGFIQGEKQRRMPIIPNRFRGHLDSIIAHITSEFQEFARVENDANNRFLFGSLTQALDNAGLHPLIISANESIANKADWLIRTGVKGVIIGEIYDSVGNVAPLVSRLRAERVPVVAHGNWTEFRDCDHVASDHENGSYLLTRWLIGRGNTRILPVWHGPADGYWFEERRRGYERAMTEANLQPYNPVVIPPVSGNEWVTCTTKAEFDQRVRYCAGHLLEHFREQEYPDAICVSTDWFVPMVAAACRLFGKEPNQDIAFVGYDNSWRTTSTRIWEPTLPLATVDKCNVRIGQELVSLLLDRFEGRLPTEPQLRVVRPELLVL